MSSTNNRLMAGAVTVSVVPHHAEPAIAETSSTPAAIDLVHRYALTRPPQGRGACGASYTGRASVSAPGSLACSAATMLTRSASAAGRWPQSQVGAARCSVGDSVEESAPT